MAKGGGDHQGPGLHHNEGGDNNKGGINQNPHKPGTPTNDDKPDKSGQLPQHDRTGAAPSTSNRVDKSGQLTQHPHKASSSSDDGGGLGGGWIFLIVILVVLVAGAIAYLFYRRWQAKKKGQAAPAAYAAAPAAGGVGGFISGKLDAIKGFKANRDRGRYATGAGYEGSRGMEADEAWDARMGTEETGYQGAKSKAPGGGYAAPNDYALEMDERGASYEDLPATGYGRGRQRDSLDSEAERDNPFGHGAERSSFRDVSPRPMESDAVSTRTKDSRRSMFREDV